MTRQMGHKPWTRLRPFISWSSCLSDHLVDSHPTLCSTYTFPKRKDSNGSLKTKTHELIYRISPRGSAVVVLRLVNHFIFNSLEHHFPIVGHALAGYNYTIIIIIIHIFIAYSYVIIIIIIIIYIYLSMYHHLPIHTPDKLFLRFVPRDSRHRSPRAIRTPPRCRWSCWGSNDLGPSVDIPTGPQAISGWWKIGGTNCWP